MVLTHVISADIFWPSHILFKYFTNFYVAPTVVCKDVDNYIVFYCLPWLVIQQWDAETIARGQFMIWILSKKRFKYWVVPFSIGAFMQFIYYRPFLHMFKYKFWRLITFRLNEDISRTFRFYVIILVVCILVHMTVSILIPFSAKVNNFVFPLSLARIIYEVDQSCCISLKLWVLRRFAL